MEPEFEPPACRRAAFASLAQAEESDISTLSEPSDCRDGGDARLVPSLNFPSRRPSKKRKCGPQKAVVGVGGRQWEGNSQALVHWTRGSALFSAQHSLALPIVAPYNEEFLYQSAFKSA